MSNSKSAFKQVISNFILFIDRNKKMILSITLSGIILLILFQKFKPGYYESTAIVTSGISEYQDVEFHKDEDVRNQRMAINLINDLQLDIDKEDFTSIKGKLNISIEESSQIKSIVAEPLLRQDKDEKYHSTPDFQITLLVRNSDIIPAIEEGLEFYFEENRYIQRYWDNFKKKNDDLIESIEEEIEDLQAHRDKIMNSESLSEISHTSNYVSSGTEDVISNEIIILEEKKQRIKTLSLIKPLDFQKPFTRTTVAEREVLILGTTVGILSFLLSLIIAFIREVKSKQN